MIQQPTKIMGLHANWTQSSSSLLRALRLGWKPSSCQKRAKGTFMRPLPPPRPEPPEVEFIYFRGVRRAVKEPSKNPGHFNGIQRLIGGHKGLSPIHTAIVAFGSNLGDRVATIENACRKINGLPTTKLVRSSCIYETKAMYVTDQADFLNGVCEVKTRLSPLGLLDGLQSIEKELKRVKVIDKGPRTIDLDILLYGDSVFHHERLDIPHKLMLEREFVLRPLCDLIPEKSHPLHQDNTFLSHLNTLSSNSLAPLTFLSSELPIPNAVSPGRPPVVMGILNVTPDSFSDGGIHDPTDQDQLQQTISNMLDSGATIIDIGGESTRPGSEPIDEDEETRRILPAVRTAVALCFNRKAIVSVDTYRATVANAALIAGAHMINDVTCARNDYLLKAVAEHDASYVLMHSRGTAKTMFSEKHTDYGDDIVATVGAELLKGVEKAQRLGVRRWRIVLDPGFGFAKTAEQNVELLERFDELKAYPGLESFPWLVGISRKKFVRGLAGLNEEKWDNDGADEGTMQVLDKYLSGKVDIHRVHGPLVAKLAQSSVEAS
ncbi:hypothetical protein BT63DRAFT_430230, partial [Microthyrium microscopicum]